MKYLKLLALCLLPLSFTACSDDDEINGGNATVGFASTEVTLTENASIIQVPIALEGDHSGLVKVNIEVTDYNGTAVTKDETVILTSGSLVMPANVASVEAELRTSVYTIEDNNDRSFTLKITSAEGASIGNATCKVNIEEIPDPYTNLAGIWEVSAGSAGMVSIKMTPREDRTAFDCSFNFQGLDFNIPMYYSAQGLELEGGKAVATGLDFGEIGVMDVWLGYVNGNYWYAQNIPASWNEDFTIINFEAPVYAGLYQGSSFAGYTWFSWSQTMRKVGEIE